MRVLWSSMLLIGLTLTVPGCYGGGYQDPEIPEDYQDLADPENLKKSMGGPNAGGSSPPPTGPKR